MGKHQSAGPHGHKLAAVVCPGAEVNTVINLQRRQSAKFDFKEIMKYYYEYKTRDCDALSLCDTNYVYLENTGGRLETSVTL